MVTIEEYKDKLMEHRADLKAQVLEVMARENIAIARLAFEIGCSWLTVKRFLTTDCSLKRKTSDKLKGWLELYEQE